MRSPSAPELAVGQRVQLVLIRVELAMLEPEANATEGGKDSNSAVVPYQERILREGCEALSDGRGDGVHEEESCGDE